MLRSCAHDRGGGAHTSYSLQVIVWRVLCGVIIQLSTLFIWLNKKYSLQSNLIFVLGLTIFFIYRWLLIRKFYPPGILTLASIFIAHKVYQFLIENRRNRIITKES